ncbi:hypothetical protein BC828DRAFT_382762 [Blastocladiella britannica]|nr:hypothetical protein BC828DRAFT_382762 [Blastocladiella britannica]
MKVAPFRYSGESILFAPITGLRFQALHLSFKLYQSNKSTFYKVLLCVTLFRIIDNALGYIQFGGCQWFSRCLIRSLILVNYSRSSEAGITVDIASKCNPNPRWQCTACAQCDPVPLCLSRVRQELAARSQGPPGACLHVSTHCHCRATCARVR